MGGEGGGGEVFLPDVVDGEGVGEGFDIGGIDFGEFFEVGKDVGELVFEDGFTIVRNVESGEVGYVVDVYNIVRHKSFIKVLKLG